MPELRHLRYFIAVAEELNFSRAAERLHMAQPPLSVAIRQLEQELGTDLLMRTTRDVRLTGAGRAFLEGARRTLAELERSIVDAQRAAAGELGSLRLAFSWSARFETLPALGQALRARHPDVELVTEEMWNARMPAALRSGTVDVAISICPERDSELAYQPIRRERIVALVAATHPLAGKGGVSLNALADDGFVLFPRQLAPRLFDVIVALCRRAGFEPKIRTESFHTGWDTGVLADVGVVALVPESVTRELPAGVAALRLSEPDEELETAILWRRDDTSAVAAAFREVARTLFEPDRL
jgi:LysR family transcriptional regulator, benzoate and cis,cis-muconate-responsive activator of ben and cat genes